MTERLHISVIIPTYQRRDMVRRALQALAYQTLPPTGYEVIVSIDGSEDGTREMVEQFAAPYTLHAPWQPNQGRAAACNAGIRAAKGQLLILLDDDMEPAPEFLAAHQQAHAAGARIGVVGAVPIAIDRSSPPVVSYIGAKFNQHLAKLSQPGYHFNLRDFYSGNFSIQRDILHQVGLFDDMFRIYGNEDLELSLRLTRAGVKLVYCPAAVAHQHYTKDFAALARDNLSKGRTAVLLATKHPETFTDLKLSTYRQGSRKWRTLRAVLLWSSHWRPRTPDLVIHAMQWLEQRPPRRLDLYYTLALDYFYWLGVRAISEEQTHAGQEPASLARR